MFVAAEMLLELSFPAVVSRLANPARGGLLTRVSQQAYDDGLKGLVRVGPPGAAPGMPKLVKVHCSEMVTHGESAVFALRWEATGPGDTLFPALDADVSLAPAGEHSTGLSLAGVYRPSPEAVSAGPGQVVFDGAADAMIRFVLARLAALSPVPGNRPAPCRKPV